MAPHAMMRGADGKAVPRKEEFDWSPVASDFSVHCPTGAIQLIRTQAATPPSSVAMPAAAER
jgi:hypothetical protein